ncbi:MAG: hypothetical protein Q9M26_07975 [Mariprofundales bacterium]|nr:hypothetical protein [Mariprofundales bacterium]
MMLVELLTPTLALKEGGEAHHSETEPLFTPPPPRRKAGMGVRSSYR